MAITDSKGRKVQEVQVTGASDDIQVTSATYEDDNSEVPDGELDWICENFGAELSEIHFDNAVCAAEYASEGDR